MYIVKNQDIINIISTIKITCMKYCGIIVNVASNEFTINTKEDIERFEKYLYELIGREVKFIAWFYIKECKERK